MIRCIHIGRIKSGNHRIQTGLLLWSQRFVCHSNVGISKRVVIQWSIRLQIVGGSKVPAVTVIPLLLKRNSEYGRTADGCAHDVDEIMNVRSFLDVIREMK